MCKRKENQIHVNSVSLTIEKDSFELRRILFLLLFLFPLLCAFSLLLDKGFPVQNMPLGGKRLTSKGLPTKVCLALPTYLRLRGSRHLVGLRLRPPEPLTSFAHHHHHPERSRVSNCELSQRSGEWRQGRLVFSVSGPFDRPQPVCGCGCGYWEPGSRHFALGALGPLRLWAISYLGE